MVVNRTSPLTPKSPLDGSLVTTVKRSEISDIPGVIERSRAGFASWKAMPLQQRGSIIRRAGGLLEEFSEELTALVRQETGKPLAVSRAEVEAATEMAYLMASHGRIPSGHLLPSSRVGRQVREQRVPRGVALLIVSYNTPLPNYAWKVFPALMAGNSAILKPSPATPASANIFVELLHRAGVPAETLQVLHGEGDVAQAAIKQGVELVSFTGSYEAGIKVAQAAYPSLAKTILELGGSNPFIVCSDADIESAVGALIDSAFSNSGQRCASGSRAIIEDSIYESFRSLLLKKSAALTWGTDPDVDVSTLIDEKARERFERMLAAASQESATVHRVGTRKGSLSSNPCLSQPAVVEGIPAESGLSTSEIFGPATRLSSFRDDTEAIKLANSSPYGLTAAIWTQDVSRAEKFVTQIEAGLININGPTHGAEVNMPFGGMKKSGNGTRDAGTDAYLQYSDSQVVSNFLST